MSDELLSEIEANARMGANLSNDTVLALVWEVRRLQTLERAVAKAWESTQRALREP